MLSKDMFHLHNLMLKHFSPIALWFLVNPYLGSSCGLQLPVQNYGLMKHFNYFYNSCKTAKHRRTHNATKPTTSQATCEKLTPNYVQNNFRCNKEGTQNIYFSTQVLQHFKNPTLQIRMQFVAWGTVFPKKPCGVTLSINTIVRRTRCNG